MKNLLIITVLVAIIASCSPTDNSFRLSGKIDDAAPGFVIFSKAVDNQLIPIDSVKTDNGEFIFSGFIEIPEIYYLKFAEDNITQRIFIEPGNIVVSGKLEEPLVTGSSTHLIYHGYMQEMLAWNERRDKLYDDFGEAVAMDDSIRMEIIRQEADEIDAGQEQFLNDFLEIQKDNVVAPYIVVSNMYQYELEDLMKKRKLFGEPVAASKYVRLLDEQIARLQSVTIGRKAPLFTQNDAEGNPVNLADFRGNYLLIDFWASWCGPCRRENPNIVAAWQKYHTEGFDILGVSLDRDRANWLKAIEDDRLTWTHVSDLKFWSNEASTLYGVNSIPASFLLDPDGIIIAKDQRHEELHQKLEEIFGY
jgi:peroxiredoxin